MALYSVNKPSSNMDSCVTTTVVAVLAIVGSSMAGVVPAAAPLVAAPAAPLVAAPAAIGYAKAVPYNVPPYASRVDISTRAVAAPLVAAAPVVAAHAAPVVAAHAAPVVAAHAAPVVAAHAAPVVAASAARVVAAPAFGHATYAGSLAAPLAHAAFAAYGPTVFG